MVPAYSAFFITSGGTLAEPAWQRIASEFLADVRDQLKSPGGVDAIYFCMHGAMASQQQDDPEGWLLARNAKVGW